MTQLALLLLLAAPGSARLTSPYPAQSTPDIVCWGPRGVEACLDNSANFIPTTNSSSNLGSSSLKWNSIFFAGTTNGVNANFTGNLGVGTNSPSSTATVVGILYINNNLSPAIVINSAGSNFGIISNVGTGNWSLGYGPNIGTPVTSVVSWGSAGGATISGQITTTSSATVQGGAIVQGILTEQNAFYLNNGPGNTPTIGYFMGTSASNQTCTTTCATTTSGIVSGICLGAWTSGLAASTCATSATNQRCSCVGAEN